MEADFVYARAFALEVTVMELIKLLPKSLGDELAGKLGETARQYAELSPPQGMPPKLLRDMHAQLQRLIEEIAGASRT